MQLKATHPMFTAHRVLKTLIEPLNHYYISYFTYRKCYTDNSCVILGTRPDWFDKYYSQKYYVQEDIQASPECYKTQVVFWSTLPNQKDFQFARALGIDHGVYLICPGIDYCEFSRSNAFCGLRVTA